MDIAFEDSPICTACGTQYHSPSNPARCPICDDPRQFVPPSGQTWTTLACLRGKHQNEFTEASHEPSITYVNTTPSFGIGQRAILLNTPDGLVLWDLVAFIDTATIESIKSRGTLRAIIISHPHFYTTYATWLAAFPEARLYIGGSDRSWLNEPQTSPTNSITESLSRIRTVPSPVGSSTQITSSVTAINAGGHFPSSMVLHYSANRPNAKSHLLVADTVTAMRSAFTPHPRPEGQTTYTFMWSYPNMIPLPPQDLTGIWNALKSWEWEVTIGAFTGTDVLGHGDAKEEREREMKARLLLSLQTVMRQGGWKKGDVGCGVLEERL